MPKDRHHDILDEPAQRLRRLWAAVFTQALADAHRDPHDTWLDSHDARTVAALAGLDPDVVRDLAHRRRAEAAAANPATNASLTDGKAKSNA